MSADWWLKEGVLNKIHGQAAPAGWQFSAPSIVSAGVEGVQFRSKVLYAPKSGQPLPIIGYTIEGPSKAVSGQISADLF